MMCLKELRIQIALGVVDFARLHNTNIFAIYDYEVYKRLFNMFLLLDYDSNYTDLFDTFWQHKFYPQYRKKYEKFLPPPHEKRK